LSEELTPEDIEEERIYTVPLRKVKYIPKKRRAEKAVKILREFIAKHMKSEEVIINPLVNEEIWSRGIEKPPARLKVKAVRTRDGPVIVFLA